MEQKTWLAKSPDEEYLSWSLRDQIGFSRDDMGDGDEQG
jgi:hypothetical protein